MTRRPDVRLKRIYAEPADTDGYRVLVDRVWPRGVSKDRADIDEWLAKFEALLRQLSWEHASVQVITEWVGQYHYHWEPRAGADVASECVQVWDRRDVRLDTADPAAPR